MADFCAFFFVGMFLYACFRYQICVPAFWIPILHASFYVPVFCVHVCLLVCARFEYVFAIMSLVGQLLFLIITACCIPFIVWAGIKLGYPTDNPEYFTLGVGIGTQNSTFGW